MKSSMGVVALSLATADQLACQPNAKQPMLPIYHMNGNLPPLPELDSLRNGSLAVEKDVTLKTTSKANLHKIKGTESGVASSSDVVVTFSGFSWPNSTSMGACVLGNATMEGLGIAITVSSSILGKVANIQVGTCSDTMHKENPVTPPGYEKFEADWDLLGGDYEVNTSSSLTGNCTADYCACQERCKSDGVEKCKSWTWVPGERCCLKDVVPPAVPVDWKVDPNGVFSGVEDPAAVPSFTWPAYRKWETDWDLLGGDYEINTSSFLTGSCTIDSCACQARCQADGPEKCKSWTLVPGKRCCLKGSVPYAQKDSGVISGVEDPHAKPFSRSTAIQMFDDEKLRLRITPDRSLADFNVEGGRWAGTVAWPSDSFAPRKPADSLVALWSSNTGVKADINIYSMGCGKADPSYTEHAIMLDGEQVI